MKTIKSIISCTMLITLLLVTAACGNTQNETADISTETETEMKQELQTAEEFRTLIAELGTDNVSLNQKMDYYLQLKEFEILTEEEFLDLSRTYETLGMQDKYRETLIDMHKWHPSKENAERIGNVIVEKNTTHTEVTNLVEKVYTLIQEEKYEDMKNLLVSEEWVSQMQDSLVGVNRKTKYADDSYTAQIISGIYQTELFINRTGENLVYYKWNQAGVQAGTLGYAENTYNGAYEITYLNADGKETKNYAGTFANNISVGTFTVKYNGTTYTGELRDNGTTEEKQIDKVQKAGNVVYAYNKSKEKYLYEEGYTVESFVVNSQYFGMPLYEAW